nr:unnamed protein product [uncultured bacterium]
MELIFENHQKKSARSAHLFPNLLKQKSARSAHQLLILKNTVMYLTDDIKKNTCFVDVSLPSPAALLNTGSKPVQSAYFDSEPDEVGINPVSFTQLNNMDKMTVFSHVKTHYNLYESNRQRSLARQRAYAAGESQEALRDDKQHDAAVNL